MVTPSRRLCVCCGGADVQPSLVVVARVIVAARFDPSLRCLVVRFRDPFDDGDRSAVFDPLLNRQRFEMPLRTGG